MDDAQQRPTEVSRKEASSMYYRTRYHSDTQFREKEKARAANYIQARREHYKQLWRAKYDRQKAAKAQQQHALSSESP